MVKSLFKDTQIIKVPGKSQLSAKYRVLSLLMWPDFLTQKNVCVRQANVIKNAYFFYTNSIFYGDSKNMARTIT